MLVYINRGFFISSATEVYNSKGEVNSVIEWVIQLVTGKENGIDEDGDTQSNCHFVQIVQHDFSQQVTQILELANLSSIDIHKFLIPTKENLPPIHFFDKIDNPPEV